MKKLRVLVCTMLLCMCSVLPTQASESPAVKTEEAFHIDLTGGAQEDMMPLWENFMEINISYGVSSDYTLYYGMSLIPYPNTSYFSGMLKLYNAAGQLVASDVVRETEAPYVSEEFERDVKSGEQYQISFEGHIYRTPGGHGERVEVKTKLFTID